MFENHRAVYGTVAAVLGASWVLRAAGDAGNGDPVVAVPDRVGPADLALCRRPLVAAAAPLTATALLVAVAVALLDRRDFAAGLRRRPGRASASRALGSPVGLAWRLQRGSVIGWALGLFLLGMAYGSFADSFDDYVADYPEIAEYLGGTANVVNAGLALTMLMCPAGGGVRWPAMQGAHRGDLGRAEPVLATATSRWAWLGSHLTVALVGSVVMLVAAGFGQGLAYGMSIADAGQIPRLIGVALVYLPAVWLVIALAVGVRLAATDRRPGGLDGRRLLRGRGAVRRLLRPPRLVPGGLPVHPYPRGPLGRRHGGAAAGHRGDRRAAPCRRPGRVPPPRPRQQRLTACWRSRSPERHQLPGQPEQGLSG